MSKFPDKFISAPKQSFQFLANGGEMGKLMLEKDWGKTPLGKAEDWPQTLRTTLSIILHSKFPMFLCWGPELFCFYNDAYRPSLGNVGKHPFILGQRAEEAWPEIWHMINPLINQVLGGGEAAWSEDQLIPIYRNGKIEDVYWTFSYSPVIDETGKPGGVLVTCLETTEKVKNLLLLEESKQQVDFAIEAGELGTWDYNPVSNKFTSNDRLKQWFGLKNETETELHHAINIIAEDDRKRVTSAIENTLVFSSGGHYDIEFSIINPLINKKLILHAKGRAWFNAEKKAYRMNGTLEDVTEKYITHKKIEQSELRFQAAIDAIEGILWTNNIAGEMEGEQLGWASLTGQTYAEYQGYGWAKVIHPDDAQPTIDAWNEAVKERKPFVFEHRVKLKEGTWGDFAVRAIPVLNKDGSIQEWVGVHTDITKQKKAAAIIRESEERFRTMAENTDVLIAVGDESSNAIYFNKAWVQLTGRPIEKLLKFGWADLIHPDDRQDFVDLYLSAFKKIEAFAGEFRALDSKNDYRWLLVQNSPRFLLNGNFAGYISSSIDITDFKKAEEALKESLKLQVAARQKIQENEERLSLIINASELGTWEINMKTRNVIYSPRFLEISGYKSGIKLSIDDTRNLIHPGDLEIRDEAFKNALETGSLNYKGRIVWEDGSVHWVESKGKLLYDNQKNPVSIIGTIADITDEKQKQQILLNSEKKFRLLANAMPQFVWTGDAEGNLNYFNEAVYKYSGFTPAQIKQEGWLQIVHADEREENIKAWLQSINTGEDFNFEHRFRRHDGEYRWQLSRAIPQKDAAGNIQMWVGTSTDIQTIKELDQQKDFFIGMASHELKTPITTIKGHVQLLQSMIPQTPDDHLKNSLNSIEKQVAVLTRLISDMLDLSKIKAGGLTLNKEVFNINEMIIEMIDKIQMINPQYIISFSKQRNTMVNADRVRISQVVINFLTNAVKYSPSIKNVEVQSIIEDNEVIISVEDFGIGISKAEQEKIFERFYRVEGKNEKIFPGFGIGLSIASEIIHQHDGKIGVKSEQGKGSIFYFSLPVHARE